MFYIVTTRDRGFEYWMSHLETLIGGNQLNYKIPTYGIC